MTGKLVKFIAIASYTVDRKSYLITAGFLGKSLTYFIAVTVVLVRQYKKELYTTIHTRVLLFHTGQQQSMVNK